MLCAKGFFMDSSLSTQLKGGREQAYQNHDISYNVQFMTFDVQLMTLHFVAKRLAPIFVASIKSISSLFFNQKTKIMTQLSKLLVSLLVKLIILLFVFNSFESNAQSKRTSVSVRDNGKTTISIKNGFGNNFAIEYKGEITLSDDDTDVIAISDGGYMEIKKAAFGSRRRIYMEPDDSGRLIKKYFVGSSQRSFDAEGKKWLSEILLEVVRTTTLGSEKRVNRLYKQGGAYKVLGEVDKIRSNHVKARYIKLLLNKSLSEKDLLRVLDEVGDIDSDHHRASILKENTKAFLAYDATTGAYIETTGSIDSDHHKASVLKRSIDDGDISDAQMKTLFTIAKDIDSDHHKASVLQAVLANRSLNDTSLKLLLNTSRDIDSDHHKSSVLKSTLKYSQLDNSTYKTLLSAATNIDSDHHMASLFKSILRNNLDTSSLSYLLQLVGDEINSDSHSASVLKDVVWKQKLSGDVLPGFLDALDHISSDNHRAEVFKQLARKSFSEKETAQILESIAQLNSDHHKTESLIAFSYRVETMGGVAEEAYINTCKSINSESQFGRAIRAIQ